MPLDTRVHARTSIAPDIALPPPFNLVTLREVADHTRKANSQPDRILFLPLWDAYALGWRDRTRVVEHFFEGNLGG